MRKLNVLFICKNFPPSPGAHSFQMGKVVESIIETGAANVFVVAGLVDRSVAGRAGGGKEDVEQAYVTTYVPYREFPTRRHYIGRVVRRVKNELRSIWPGQEWVVNAIKEARTLIKSNSIDIIFTSSTPFESHLVGRLLAKEYRLPWIAAFSDPWPAALMPHPYNNNSVPILGSLQKHCVKRILAECSAVQMPNRVAIEFMEAQTSIPIGGKGYAIPHIGNRVSRAERTQDLRGWLLHVGSLDRERVSPELVQALIDVRSDHARDINGLMLVGVVSPEFKDLVKKLRAESHVRYVGEVPQDEAAQLICNAPALLALEANMPVSPFLPSKFADYACAGKPIIAVTPEESPMRDYLARYGGGVAVRHDVGEIVAALRKVFAKHDPAEQALATDMLCSEFSHTKIGEKFVEMFKLVLAQGNQTTVVR